ncbi:MAG: fused MFS/spermidine synthase [Pyrinomonadaceae bacterium]
MIFEIIGSRILSPFIGASTYIWTSLIGVILAALSLGYWLGGRLADKNPEMRILATAIFVAGALVSVTTLIKDIVLSTIANAAMMLELKAVIASLLLFAPASICLGFVTPFAVRLATTSVDQTGRTVGRLYALSTIGSIVGTFAAGFLLIPFVGSVRTLYLIAGSLITLSLLLIPFSINKASIAAITLFVFGVAASEGNAYLQYQNSRVLDIDTEYSRVQIFETKDPKTGKPIRALATDPYFVQSAMFLDSDDLVLEYSKYYHLIAKSNPDLKRTLIIGGAGYSFPKEYLKTYPQAEIDVVEIDPGMTQIARDHFRLVDDPRMHIIHQDGRMFIDQAASEQYDAILMDAFGSLFSVPTHLTTIEAVHQFHRLLKPNGVLIFNLGGAITGPASGFLTAELATYQSVFPNVTVSKVNPEYPDEKLQNLIMIAAKTPLLSKEGSPSLADVAFSPNPNTTPLTDDLAPVEHYNSIAQNIYLQGN